MNRGEQSIALPAGGTSDGKRIGSVDGCEKRLKATIQVNLITELEKKKLAPSI